MSARSDDVFGVRPRLMDLPSVTITFGDNDDAFVVFDTCPPDGLDTSSLPPIRRAGAVARLRAAADLLEAAQ